MPDFSPVQGDYTNLSPFRFWCQKVLPLVYDDSLSYYELLCKVVDYLNKMMDNLDTMEGDVTNMFKAFKQLNDYVNNYFNTLDVQEEINNKLDDMSKDGSLSALIAPFIKATPQYAENIAAMTDINVLYINGEDGYLYHYKNGAWSSTGILYQSTVMPFIGTSFMINGNMTLVQGDYETDGTMYTLMFSEQSRLMLKNGNIVSPNLMYTFKYPHAQGASGAFYDIMFDAEANIITPVRFSEQEQIADPKYSPLFGIYNNRVFEFYTRLLTSVPVITYPGELTYCSIVSKELLKVNSTETGIECIANNLRIVDSSGNISTLNGTFTFELQLNILNYICWDRTKSQLTVLTYSQLPLLYTTAYDILFAYYNNSVHEYTTHVLFNYIPNDNDNTVIKGGIFVYVSGSNIKVECTSYARARINNVNTNISSWSLDTPSSTAGVRYITMESDGFYVRQANSPLLTDKYIIALAYQDWVLPMVPTVVGNSYPLRDMKSRTNIDVDYNFDRLGYRFCVSAVAQNTNKVTIGDGWIRLKNPHGANLGLGYYDDYNRYNPFGVTVTHNTATLGSKKILMIGDSITNRGWLQQYLIQYEPDLQFVGTKQTGEGIGVKDYMCEGYPGKSSSWIISSEGPFWNPNTKALDFNYYCTTNNIAPDLITIEFGLNERIYGAAFQTNIQALITSIKNYNATIPIYLVEPFRRRIGAHSNTYSSGADYNKQTESCRLACQNIGDVTLIPANQIFNDMYDYVSVQLDYGYGGITYTGVNDPIHPSQEIGFKKLADIIYTYLE